MVKIMLQDYEIKALTANNYDDIILYFRHNDSGINATKWIITNADADELRKGDLIICFNGGLTRQALQNLINTIPNNFYFGVDYTDELGETVKINHLRFKPSPKTSGRNLSDWLHTKTNEPKTCGNCKKLDDCAGGSDIERAAILDRDAADCLDFQ